VSGAFAVVVDKVAATELVVVAVMLRDVVSVMLAVVVVFVLLVVMFVLFRAVVMSGMLFVVALRLAEMLFVVVVLEFGLDVVSELLVSSDV